MKKIILSSLAAAFVASALLVQPAAAACWSNGFATQCSHPHFWHHHFWHHGGPY